MRSMKKLSFLLAFAMLVSVFQIPVSAVEAASPEADAANEAQAAAEPGEYSEEDIFYGMEESNNINFAAENTTIESLKQIGTFTHSNTSVTGEDSDSFEVDTINGLTLKTKSASGSSNYDEGLFNLNSNNIATNSDDTGAIKVTFKNSNTGTLQLNYRNAGKRIRFWQDPNGELGYLKDGNQHLHDTNEIISPNTWYTYIIRWDGKNEVYYRKLDNGNYVKVKEFLFYVSGGNQSSLQLQSASATPNDSTSVKELVQYKRKSQAFTDAQVYNKKLTNVVDAVYRNDKSNWTMSVDSVTLNDGVITVPKSQNAKLKFNADPAAPYQIYFKSKMTGGLNGSSYIFIINNKRMYITQYLDRVTFGSGEAYGRAKIATAVDTEYEYLIKLAGDDTYNCYRRGPGEANWTMLIKGAGMENNSGTELGFYGGESIMTVRDLTLGDAEPEPTEAPTDTPEPTDTPTTVPEPAETPSIVPEPTETATIMPESTEAPSPEPMETLEPEPTDDHIYDPTLTNVVDKEYSGTESNWNMDGTQATFDPESGVVNIPPSSRAFLNFEGDITKPYQIYFKAKMTESANVNGSCYIFHFNKSRLYITQYLDRVTFGSGEAFGRATITTDVNKEYEYLVKLKGDGTYDCYRRDLGQRNWTLLKEGAGMDQNGADGSTQLGFYGGTTKMTVSDITVGYVVSEPTETPTVEPESTGTPEPSPTPTPTVETYTETQVLEGTEQGDNIDFTSYQSLEALESANAAELTHDGYNGTGKIEGSHELDSENGLTMYVTAKADGTTDAAGFMPKNIVVKGNESGAMKVTFKNEKSGTLQLDFRGESKRIRFWHNSLLGYFDGSHSTIPGETINSDTWYTYIIKWDGTKETYYRKQDDNYVKVKEFNMGAFGVQSLLRLMCAGTAVGDSTSVKEFVQYKAVLEPTPTIDPAETFAPTEAPSPEPEETLEPEPTDDHIYDPTLTNVVDKEYSGTESNWNMDGTQATFDPESGVVNIPPSSRAFLNFEGDITKPYQIYFKAKMTESANVNGSCYIFHFNKSRLYITQYLDRVTFGSGEAFGRATITTDVNKEYEYLVKLKGDGTYDCYRRDLGQRNWTLLKEGAGMDQNGADGSTQLGFYGGTTKMTVSDITVGYVVSEPTETPTVEPESTGTPEPSPTPTPEVPTYTEDQVLEGTEKGDNIDFTSYQSLEALESAGAVELTHDGYTGTGKIEGSHELDGENGLTMYVTAKDEGGTDAAGFMSKNIAVKADEPGAIKVTFKNNDTGTPQLDYRGEGRRIRFWQGNGLLGYLTNGNQHLTIPGETIDSGAWYTYIIKWDGTKEAYYRRLDDGNYVKAIEFDHAVVGGDQSLLLMFCSSTKVGDSLSVKEFVQYKAVPEPTPTIGPNETAKPAETTAPTGMPAPSPTPTSEITAYTETQVLEGTEQGDNIDFTSYQNLEALESANVAELTHDGYTGTGKIEGSHELDGENGLTMYVTAKADGTTDFGGFMPKNIAVKADEPGAIKVTFRNNDTGTSQLDYRGEGRRIRFYQNHGQLGYLENGNKNLEVDGEKINSDTWYTYIIKWDGTKEAYYRQLDDGNYVKVIEFDHAVVGGDQSLLLMFAIGSVGDSLSVKEFVQYKAIPTPTATIGPNETPKPTETTAPAPGEYTEAQVLDGTELGDDINFTKYSDIKELESADAVELTHDGYDGTGQVTGSHELDSENGLTMYITEKAGGGTDAAGFKAKNIVINAIEPGAIKVTFKNNDTGTPQLDYRGEGKRIRFWQGNGLLGYLADGNQHLTILGEKIDSGTWYTYIIKWDGTKEAYYRKLDNGNYVKVIEFDFAVVGGSQSLLQLMCTSANVGDSISVKELVQYKTASEPIATREPKPILEDESKIIAEETQTIITEDFGSRGDWEFSDSSVRVNNGILTVPTGQYAILAFPDANPNIPYQIYYRYKVNSGGSGSAIISYLGGKRIYPTVYTDRTIFGASASCGTVEVATIPDVWYEYLCTLLGDGTYNYYRRRSGEAEWTLLLDKIPLEDFSADFKQIRIGSGSSGVEVSDLSVFVGMQIVMNEPAVSGNTINADGEIYFGTSESEYDRRATVIAAAYDKKYGYTTKVVSDGLVAAAGERTKIQKQLEMTDVDLSGSNLSVMLWDSFDTAFPMADAKMYTTPNNAAEDADYTDMTCEADYNEVRIRGFAGKVCNVAAVLTDADGNVAAVMQAPTNSRGMIDSVIAVDPYSFTEGEYTLRLAYGGQLSKTYTYTLHGDDIGYNNIDGEESFKSFIDKYGNASAKETADRLTAKAYNRFIENKNGRTFADLYEFREAVDKALYDTQMEDEILTQVNEAVRTNSWPKLEELLTRTYKDYLGIDLSMMQGVKSIKNMFMRMTGNTFTSLDELTEAYEEAATEQRQYEISSGGTGSGGGGGFGGGSGGGTGSGGRFYGSTGSGSSFAVDNTGPAANNAQDNINNAASQMKPFTDLGTVPWAQDSIKYLQQIGIVAGDGNGNFYPDNSVTREEFLKMLMESFGIKPGATDAVLLFTDIDPDEWYCGYVRAAYTLGIVKGVSEDRFGIGEPITRADMAVMVKRTLDSRNKALDKIRPSRQFNDFAEIPDYAFDSISYLYETEILNGDENNMFAPGAFTTRAEAAVVIYRLRQKLN